jgi:hypothetical protein
MGAFGLSANCGTRPPRNFSQIVLQYIFSWLENSRRPRSSHCWGSEFTLGKNPLDEWSASRRDLYLTTHNAYQWQTSMPPAVFDPPVPARKQPQTHALDGAATRIGIYVFTFQLRLNGSGEQTWTLYKLHLQTSKPNGKKVKKILHFYCSLCPWYTVSSQGSYFITKTVNVRMT